MSSAAIASLAACHHGVSETAHTIAKRVAAARHPLLFVRGHQRDGLVVPTFLGDGARAGRIAIGPDAAARVRSGLEQQPRHLDVARHDRDVERADFKARRSPAQQIDPSRRLLRRLRMRREKHCPR
jgi:hypothetical protein